MRKSILISFVLLIAFAASLQAGVNYWTPIGPFGGETAALAGDPQQSSVIYAAARGGVFKTVNGGATWRRMSRGLSGSAAEQVLGECSGAWRTLTRRVVRCSVEVSTN
jgi:hypothetical protein